mmetsp:Transcript_15178/g.21550  ORF Transcript_15178/g.21550 Transcript_15178/m.21550 type:complete len:444 (+) Transcript_15178:42-1373(+)
MMRTSTHHNIPKTMGFLITFICIIVSVEVANHQHCVVSAWSSQGGISFINNGKRASIATGIQQRRVQLLTTTTTTATSNLFSSSQTNDNNNDTITTINSNNGELERLKKEEQRLSSLLDSIRQQKLAVLRSRPLSIGIVGFGRFGQFIAASFTKYGHVVATSRTDYTDVASEMGVKYVSTLEEFVLEEHHLDVIVLATSIVSFKDTVLELVSLLEKKMQRNGGGGASCCSCPLIVDVASVKEHPRDILLDLLPEECDVLCTHPMFGPDSAKSGWRGQTFVYEKTRINKVILDPDLEGQETTQQQLDTISEEYVEGMDRMERFLSIWEEEGCNMIPMRCSDHDSYSANSQFITHLVGRILGVQGLKATPIDTTGFQSVLRLIETTNADSFDLFYGLYKYNRNSGYTIGRLRGALDDVVGALLQRDGVVGVFDGGNRKSNNDDLK